MSGKDKIGREDFEALSPEEIELAKQVFALKEKKRLDALPWGSCHCGKKFTMGDRAEYGFCPRCGLVLNKDE